MTTSRYIFSHPTPFVATDGPSELQEEEMTQIDRWVKILHSKSWPEREDRRTRVVKESSPEEEPMERSLRKTMATPAVGCETARARKRL